MKIKKVLIANRGEIACRIIKTLQKMNIFSVAVYSEGDANSLHTQMADESFCIGPAQSIKSYLNIDAICNAALDSKADAVHPGFGFLSENSEFAKRLDEIGICFIGPSPEVIKIMGDKIKAKKVANEAGVDIIDGYIGAIDNVQEIITTSESIGFPIIIKAAAGGGGKGMRIVNSKEEIEEALILASSEAEKSFADNRLFIERYIERPRHIEIQILADKFGNVLCLGERECSIQRRYQKVIEEAPSSFITDKVRKKMYKQSSILAKKVGYYSAGTVEFIMDRDRNFYFLEMNTRIQVEHPVTELVTGFDLIQEMIKIEENNKLTIKQDEVQINGHAIETRVYAEDPANNFLPASGVISHYMEPKNDKNIRIDSGIQAGAEVTMFYDPMLAKICTHAKNREDAISYMRLALKKFYILGVENNISFLQSIISQPSFISGELYTDFIKDFYPDGFKSNELTNEITKVFCAVILYIYLTNEYRNTRMFSGEKLARNWIININKKLYNIESDYFEGALKIQIGTESIMLNTIWIPGDTIFIANINDDEFIIKLNKKNSDYTLEYDGCKALCKVYRPDFSPALEFMHSQNNKEDNTVVISPITGMITKIYVSEGDEVKTGQPLFIVEAMKMENTFYAKINAKIARIKYSEGENVNSNDVIIEY